MYSRILSIGVVCVVILLEGCRQDHKQVVVPSNSCVTTNITFADVKPIFDRDCNGCHEELETEADAKAWGALSMIVAAVKHEPSAVAMPKGGLKLTECEINKIEAWYNTIK